MEKCRVLLVDDEKDFLEVLIRRLSKRQVNVDGVSSGEEALQYLQVRPIDVAVLDVKMPGMDGITVLREIKKLNPLIEVIMLTGHASLEVALEGMRSGANLQEKPAKVPETRFRGLRENVEQIWNDVMENE